jgi:hypothetical protein
MPHAGGKEKPAMTFARWAIPNVWMADASTDFAASRLRSRFRVRRSDQEYGPREASNEAAGNEPFRLFRLESFPSAPDREK